MNLIIALLFANLAQAAEVWKVEHSAVLRRNVPGTPQYANTSYASRAECEKAIDDSQSNNNNPTWRKNFTCVLMSSSRDIPGSAQPESNPQDTSQSGGGSSSAAKLGSAIAKNIFSPEQTGQNIVGENNYQDFGGKKPDALGRDQYGVLASNETTETAVAGSSSAEKIIAILDCVVKSVLEEFQAVDQQYNDVGVQADLEIIKNTLRVEPSGKKDSVVTQTITFDSQKKEKSNEKQFVGSIVVTRNEQTGEVHIHAIQSSTKNANRLLRIFGKKKSRKESQNTVVIDRSGNVLDKEVTGSVKRCIR